MNRHILAQSNAELKKAKIDFLVNDKQPLLLQISSYQIQKLKASLGTPKAYSKELQVSLHLLEPFEHHVCCVQKKPA